VFPDSGRPRLLVDILTGGEDIRLLRATEAHSEAARLEVLPFEKNPTHYFKDAHPSGVECKYPCALCAALGKPQLLLWKKK
jgi:hypothetical protein